MNLETSPMSATIRIPTFIFNDMHGVGLHRWDVDVIAHGHEQAQGVARKTLQAYANAFVFIPEFSSVSRHSISGVKILGVNYFCTIRETLANAWRIECWNAIAAMTGAGTHEVVVNVKEVEQSPDNVVSLGVDGVLSTYAVKFDFDDHYSETCSTCQMGKNLLKVGLDQINGSIILDSKVDQFAFGDVKCSESLFIKQYLKENDVTLGDWFATMQAGAVEMAHVSKVRFIGV